MVSAIRAAWAVGDLAGVRGYLDALDTLGIRHDAEGFHPLLHAWRGRLAAIAGDREAALAHIRAAEAPGANRWAYQECRIDLSLARAYAQLHERPLALARAESALRRAEAGGFRFYALKAHALAATVSDDEAAIARHRRVSAALARSLAANLPREDSERFLEAHGAVLEAGA